MNEMSEALHRTIKLALDDGSAASLDHALERFQHFRICVDVRVGATDSPGLEAALLTVLNAAPRTFLGGVEVTGALDEKLHLAWFRGMTVGEAALAFGVRVAEKAAAGVPTLVLGPGPLPRQPFVLALRCTERGFRLSPDANGISAHDAPVEYGIAAAGAALNEAFQHVYAQAPLAGQRTIAFELPGRAEPGGSVWAVGLGHLGQATLWSLALRYQGRPTFVRLQDPDRVTVSSLSTCLLASPQDVGRLKVDVVADKLQQVGIRCERVGTPLMLGRTAHSVTADITMVSVDNVALRRSLDALTGPVIEAGIGDGIEGFTRVQLHLLPGPRRSADIWADGDPRASRAVDISRPAYQDLLAKTQDECGTTMLAGRSIATPFVGAFAGACMAAHARLAHRTQWDWNWDVNSL